MTTWAQEIEAKGYEKGLQEMRNLVLHLIKKRFRGVSGEIRRRIAAIDSAEELTRLAERVVVASSPADLRLA